MTIRFITLFISISFISCGQEKVKYKPNPAAVQLNNEALTLIDHISNYDSSRKALLLLDKATAIDSNYFFAYANKLMFYYELKQFDNAVSANNKLIQLRPNAHDLYLTGGILYEIIGDTVSSKEYFNKSLRICNIVLDTMKKQNRNFVMLATNKAINLLMLGDSLIANKILEDLYNRMPDDEEYDNVEKEYIQSLMHKSKRELIDSLMGYLSSAFLINPVNSR